MAALLLGKTTHGYYVRSLQDETQVENTLLDMYIKCGCLTYANMAKRDCVAWNSMIGGFGSNTECHKAVELFHEMRNSGTEPDEITFLSLLSSCNHGGLVDEGLEFFRSMRGYGVEPNMQEPNMQHYVNMVDLLGHGGHLDEASEFIENMAIPPGRGDWLSLLSVCRVHGNVELGEMAAHNLIEMEPQRGSNYMQLLNMYVEAGLKEEAAGVRAVMREKGVMKVPECTWVEFKNKVRGFLLGGFFIRREEEIYETLDSLKNNMKRRECQHEKWETLKLYCSPLCTKEIDPFLY